jgi:hypothetical protein
MKTHLIILTLFVAVVAHAQDPMAKWKPSVGDRFVYLFQSKQTTYWHGTPYYTDNAQDTETVEVVATDSGYDSLHTVVVVKQIRSLQVDSSIGLLKPFDTSVNLYYFHPGQNIASAHSLAIVARFGDALNNSSYDFSGPFDTNVTFASQSLTVYRFATSYSFHDPNSGPNSGYYHSFAWYSPDLHWLCRWGDDGYPPPPPNENYSDYNSSYTLISATNLKSKVIDLATDQRMQISLSDHYTFLHLSITGDQKSATMFLLDPLGRPVCSWQLAATDGPREITLNVSDVPCGVYFLRLQGDGVDEVRKVLIAR